MLLHAGGYSNIYPGKIFIAFFFLLLLFSSFSCLGNSCKLSRQYDNATKEINFCKYLKIMGSQQLY